MTAFLTGFFSRAGGWWAARPTHSKIILTLAIAVFLTELAFRRFAPKSSAYASWTRVFQTIGKFWTAVILSLVYFLSVSFVSLLMRLLGKDPLDRSLGSEASFWRAHDPNPLGSRAAARHQF